MGAAEAKWSELEKELQEVNWQSLDRGTAEDALHYFMEILLICLHKYIPFTAIRETRKSHPWLNERCEEAVEKKNKSEGKDTFAEAQAECSRVLAEEYHTYVGALKEKIAGLSKSSKQWWRLNRELLNKKARTSSIPPLKHDGNWISDAKTKANAFAKTFTDKSQLPPETVDTPFFSAPQLEFDEIIAIRSRRTEKLFRQLDTKKASGHDKLPAALLKRLAKFIAVPFTKVCRRLLHEGCWPRMWKLFLFVHCSNADRRSCQATTEEYI